MCVREQDVISIHAPAWGATGWHRPPCWRDQNFNSRPRVGGDPVAGGDGRPGGTISIHAPAWGATVCQLLSQNVRDFNSRPRVGGDGAWRINNVNGTDFNSRPRVGGDGQNTAQPQSPQDISIHAPAWGATRAIAHLFQKCTFQFTPPRGGRRTRLPPVR